MQVRQLPSPRGQEESGGLDGQEPDCKVKEAVEDREASKESIWISEKLLSHLERLFRHKI